MKTREHRIGEMVLGVWRFLVFVAIVVAGAALAGWILVGMVAAAVLTFTPAQVMWPSDIAQLEQEHPGAGVELYFGPQMSLGYMYDNMHNCSVSLDQDKVQQTGVTHATMIPKDPNTPCTFHLPQ